MLKCLCTIQTVSTGQIVYSEDIWPGYYTCREGIEYFGCDYYCRERRKNWIDYSKCGGIKNTYFIAMWSMPQCNNRGWSDNQFKCE